MTPQGLFAVASAIIILRSDGLNASTHHSQTYKMNRTQRLSLKESAGWMRRARNCGAVSAVFALLFAVFGGLGGIAVLTSVSAITTSESESGDQIAILTYISIALLSIGGASAFLSYVALISAALAGSRALAAPLRCCHL